MTALVFGIDGSVTRTGLARPDGTTVSITATSGANDSDRRLDVLSSKVDREFRCWPGATLLVIEAVLLHGPGPKALLRLGELSGAIKRDAFRLGIYVVEIPGTMLKSAATGNGNASKDAMVEAALAAGADVANHDEADAWHARMTGVRALAQDPTLPPSVAALGWPTPTQRT